MTRASPSQITATTDQRSKAAQVVGLAHVAGGSAGKRGLRDPVAVGRVAAPAPGSGRSRCWRRRRRRGRCRRRGTPEMPRPARATQAPIAITRQAASSVPADESESDHGAPAKTEAPSAATGSGSRSKRAGRCDPANAAGALCASPAPSTSRKPPQPTKAAAWLKKVADGARVEGDQGRNRRSRGTPAGQQAAAGRGVEARAKGAAIVAATAPGPDQKKPSRGR